jgi:hypothetical protein
MRAAFARARANLQNNARMYWQRIGNARPREASGNKQANNGHHGRVLSPGRAPALWDGPRSV